jgi:hypothetical protein
VPNWIAGRAVEPDRAAWHGRVPRASLDDARAAVAAAQASARAADIAAWAARVRAELALPSAAYAALGLDADERLRLAELERARFDAPLPSIEAPAIAWLALRWNELGAAPLARARALLEGGRAVVLAPDPRWPDAADLAARAWVELGLPGGQLQVLHGIERGDRERERMEALLRRCGAVRVPTRANRPALYVNLDGPLDALAELPPGPWLCLRRNS